MADYRYYQKYYQRYCQKYYQKFLNYIILGLLCVSCTGNNQVKTPTENNAPDLPINIIYNEFVAKEKSDYILIPVSISPDVNQEREGIFNRSEKKTKNYYNIIFYNKSDGKTSLLLDKEAIIKSFNFIEIQKEDNSTQGFWLYKIIDKDTNNDNKLNHKDAIIGYISDSSGKNIRQITPDNTQLLNWQIIASRGELLLKVLQDVDENKIFSEQDNATLIKINLNKPQIGNELIKDEIKQKIRSYIKK